MDRRAIAVSGIVQGVGFRPFVYGLATRLRLRGFVKNVSGGVLIEVEGEPHSLDRFLDELTAQPPPLARIDELRWSSRAAARRSVVPDRAQRARRRQARSSSRPTSRPATIAWPSCSIPATAAIAIPSSTAPTAARG